MKNRNWMRAALLMVLAGVVCLGVSFALAGGTPRAYADMWQSLDQNGAYTTETYTADGAVRSLVISDENYGVRVCPSADGQTRVSYTEGEHEHYNITLTDGALVVDYKSDRPWYSLFSFSFGRQDRTVVVEVPADALETLRVYCGSGDMEISDIAVNGEAEAKAVNGSLRLSGVTVAGDLRAFNTNGDTLVQECESGSSIFATSVNGEISVTGSRAAVDLTAESTNSRIRVGECQAGGAMRVGNVNGDVEISSATVADNFRASTVNGAIRTQLLRAARVEIQSVNGDIIANLSGDEDEYVFDERTLEGYISLVLSSTNGEIQTSFSAEP